MINRITSIKNLGIYRDYKAEHSLKDFSRFNLFYGWNGSGKTTISKLFKIIENRNISEEFKNLKFNILINSQKNSEKDIVNLNENIYVFNEDFINENIDWDEKVNKILLLSKDKIEETKEYNSLKIEINGNKLEKTNGLRETVNKESEKVTKEFQEIEDSYSRIAKNIKNIFNTIDPTDKKYSSLNKNKIQMLCDDKEKIEECLKYNLSDDDVKKLVTSIQSEKKQIINSETKEINQKSFIELYFMIKKELLKVITAKVIERLKEETDVANWVDEGLKLYKKNQNKLCEFCGNMITDERIIELEGHFNDEQSKTKDTLDKMIDELKNT